MFCQLSIISPLDFIHSFGIYSAQALRQPAMTSKDAPDPLELERRIRRLVRELAVELLQEPRQISHPSKIRARLRVLDALVHHLARRADAEVRRN